MWTPERLWRLFGTGILYVIFGAGSVFLGLVVMLPLAALFAAAPQRRVRWWRRVIQAAFAGFVRLAGWLRVFDVRFTNTAGLQKPGQMIVANHPSLLDVVILISKLPDVDCVIKHRLSRNPFVSVQVWMADYVRNDSAEEVVRECARRLDAGRSLIVFPEGTRTRRSQPLKFQRGAARMMLACDAPVRPVVIQCYPRSLAKGDPWYSIPERRIQYQFVVEPCLDIDEFRRSSRAESARARRLTSHLEEWFKCRLAESEATSVYPGEEYSHACGRRPADRSGDTSPKS